jgi:hypothetical protein
MTSARPISSDASHTPSLNAQRTKWKEDLRSIQPINGGNSSGGGVLDRFGKRDLGRCVRFATVV